MRQQREKKKAAEVKDEPKPVVEEKKPRASARPSAGARRSSNARRASSASARRRSAWRASAPKPSSAGGPPRAGRRAQAEKVAAPSEGGGAAAGPGLGRRGAAKARAGLLVERRLSAAGAPASPPAPARLLDLSASRPLQPAAAARAADDVDDLLRAAMDVTLDDSDPRVPARRAAAPIGPPGVGAIGRAPGRPPVDEPQPPSSGWGFGGAGPQLGAVGLPWAGSGRRAAENPGGESVAVRGLLKPSLGPRLQEWGVG